MTWLAKLAQALRPIDLQLGLLMVRLGERNEASELVGLAAALVSRWRGQGHSALDLDFLPSFLPSPGGPLPLPSVETLRQALLESDLVGRADNEARPLILSGSRLYLTRYFRAESRLVENLKSRMKDAGVMPPFSSSDLQEQAVAQALTLKILLLSGGPGTGKTTTLAQLLSALAARQERPRVALAAPTGKAAARLGEALQRQVESLELDEEQKSWVNALKPSTLHRLLAFQPESNSFARRPEAPLAFDLVLIDEASMVDLLLIDALFAALPPSAGIVLVGDRDQLQSVETGSVFGDLCRAAVTNPALPAIELRKNWRFRDRPGLGELAAALRDRDVQTTLRALDGRHPGLNLDRHPGTPELVLERLGTHIESVLTADTPAIALERLASLRILAAVRAGTWGLDSLNLAVERLLVTRGFEAGSLFYRGRPILVRENDYEVELMNGDLGILWPEENRLWAFFPSPTGLKRLALGKLPIHDTAWVMTVHQSQGSEFDRVLLVLPPEDHPVLSRELIYTGVTRARQALDVIADPEVLARAIERNSARASGLVEMLAQA
jgi:exodeoxyribonuclease V alpha subunit